MAISATTLALIGAGAAAAGSTIGAIGGAANRESARNASNAWYDYAEDFSRSQAASNIFDMPGTKALLKINDKNNADSLDAVSNQMMAGGATMENALAARQSVNERRDKVNMGLIQADQSRREAWNRQLMDIKGQRAKDEANSYLQAAQDWNQWGGQMAQAGMSVLNAGLLGGLGSGAAAGEAGAEAAGSGLKFAPLAPARKESSAGGLMTV